MTTSSRVARAYWDGTGLLLLMAALLAGPLAWTLNQGIGYAVMKPVCRGAATYVLWLTAVASLTLAGAGAWIGWLCVRQLQAAADDDGDRVEDRSYFLAVVAIAFNVLIGLLILTSLVPQFVLSPCE